MINVQTRYIVFAWDQPNHGSFYQIHNYTIERKTSASEDFTVVKTLPFDQTRTTLKDLKPSTEYTIRLSSNNRYGQSDGVLLTKGTLPGKCYDFKIVYYSLTVIYSCIAQPPPIFFFFHATIKSVIEKQIVLRNPLSNVSFYRQIHQEFNSDYRNASGISCFVHRGCLP